MRVRVRGGRVGVSVKDRDRMRLGRMRVRVRGGRVGVRVKDRDRMRLG